VSVRSVVRSVWVGLQRERRAASLWRLVAGGWRLHHPLALASQATCVRGPRAGPLLPRAETSAGHPARGARPLSAWVVS